MSDALPLIVAFENPAESIAAAVQAFVERTPRAADFAAELARCGVLAAHPDTIAQLDARAPGWRTRWRTTLGVRAVLPNRLLEPGKLYTGSAFQRRPFGGHS